MWWLILPVFIYSAGMLVLHLILIRRRSLPGYPVPGLAKVSVVVAAKDEEKNLPALLESLARQDYPSDLLEVIIVNDNSTDRTPVLVSEFIAGLKETEGPRMRLIYNPLSGKKRAVRYGIERATGDVIITTDADCIVGSSWVRMHAEWYQVRNSVQHRKGEGSLAGVTAADDNLQGSTTGSCCPDMVLAPVVQKPGRGFWSYFGVFEFSALQAITASTASAGYPVMSNAANMSFRRDVYLRHSMELKDDLPSGDDMFLLEAVMRGGGAVRHDGRSAAAVETAGAVTAAALLRQRARWASKATHLRSPQTLTLAAATAACNAAVTAAAVAACFSAAWLPVVAAMYGIKAIPDYLLTAGEMKRRGNRMRIMQFIGSELLYPFYFMVVWMISMFPSSRRFAGK